VVGPIVLSLLPAFGAWLDFARLRDQRDGVSLLGVIYSILGGLITAVNIGTVQQVLTSGAFMGGFAGSNRHCF